MTFSGFTKNGLTFLRDLEANNNREWFQSHKAIFQQELEMPAKEFLAEMSRQIEQRYSVSIKAKIFRIYRDVRFSKDKTPYNPYIRMAFVDTSPTANNRAFYFSYAPSSLILGVGCTVFDNAALEKYRAAVDDVKRGEELDAILEGFAAKGFRLEEPELKRVPAGFDKYHVRENLLRRKGLRIWYDGTADEVAGPEAIDNCLNHFERMIPLFNWLGKIS